MAICGKILYAKAPLTTDYTDFHRLIYKFFYLCQSVAICGEILYAKAHLTTDYSDFHRLILELFSLW